METSMLFYGVVVLAIIYAFLGKLDNSRNSVNIWNKIIRSMVIVSAISAWVISAGFSRDGLGFQMGNENKYKSIGVIMALIVTVVQLSGNRIKGNKGITMYVLYLSAYAYSISTNFFGILSAKEIVYINGVEQVVKIAFDNLDIYLPLAWAIFLDLFPEPFLLWAWSNGDEISDPIGQVAAGAKSTVNEAENLYNKRVKEKYYRASGSVG